MSLACLAHVNFLLHMYFDLITEQINDDDEMIVSPPNTVCVTALSCGDIIQCSLARSFFGNAVRHKLGEKARWFCFTKLIFYKVMWRHTCGVVFSDRVTVKEFLNSVNIWRRYV